MTNYQTLDDVPESDVQRAFYFMGAAVNLTPSKTATRIAQTIADECLLKGESALPHKEFERRTGSGRRTVQKALAKLVDRRVIRRVRRTEAGHSVYECCWERGQEWRAEREARIHGGR